MDRIVFRNVSVFDGSGAARFVADVLVEGAEIREVRRGGGVATEGARVIDGGGRTLMPGLIDFHVHLSLGSTVESINRPLDRDDAEAALLMAHCGRVLLDHGFTAGYSGGSASVRCEIAAAKAFAAGWVPGPRLRTSSFERVPGGPMGLTTRFPDVSKRAPDVAAVVGFVEEMADLGVDAVKFLLNGVSAFDPGANGREQFYDDEILAAGEAARRRGVALTAHCYTAHSVKLALRAGFRNLYHCMYLDDEALDLLAARRDGIFVGPAPGIVEADLQRAPKFGVMASDAQRAEQSDAVTCTQRSGRQMKARGIRLLPGGDYGFPWNPIGLNARDLELFVEWFGFTPTETLHAATAVGAQAVGMADKIGQVKPGFLADLLLVQGDPTDNVGLLKDRANLLAIMQNGRLHKAPAG
jgi:imidazolonepropionase-like amidohydrolase